MKIIDTHCHLNDEALYKDLDNVISRALSAGVEKMVVIGWDKASSELAIKRAEQYDVIYAVIGFHPENIFDINDGEFIKLRGVDFLHGAKKFSISAASTGTCKLTLRIDSQDGPIIGETLISDTGSVEKYKTFNAKVSGAQGVHDLYLCFSNSEGDTHLDYWQFK